MLKRKSNLYLPENIISVIVVTYNDENIIENILKDINEILYKKYHYYEIIVVDNCSEDNTTEKIRALQRNQHVRVIKLSKKYNNEIALTAGLDSCIGDYAILFNIYTDPPSIISNLIDKLVFSYDIAIGTHKEGLVHKDFLSKLFLFIVKKLSTHEFYYDSNYLIALNRKTINSITRIRRRSRNFSYINSLIGYKRITVEYKPLKSNISKLKAENFLKLIWRITDIIISNSYKPMRILVALGMLISFAFLTYVFMITMLTLILNKSFAPKGWISISSVLGTMFFLLFSLLTLISEYLIRVLDESRNEPLYFISEETDKSVISVKKNKLNVL